MTDTCNFSKISVMLDDTIPTSNSDAASTQPESVQVIQESPQEMPQEPPPPAGDGEKSEKYLNQLVELINQDKLPVIHTNLNQFNVTSIEDHYRMDLGEYEVEINHSKQPDTGQDFYVMLFNNIKKIEDGGQNCVNKVILAYTHLTQTQFEDFKEAADSAIERKKKAEEAKRFAAAMNPIDDLLSNLGSSTPATEEKSADTEEAIADEEEPEELADDDFNDEPKASDFAPQPALTI